MNYGLPSTSSSTSASKSRTAPSRLPAQSSSHHHQPSSHQPRQEQTQTQQPQISPDQLSEITESFHLFDLNTDGYLNYHELRVAMKALGFEKTKMELVGILKEVGVQGAGTGGVSGLRIGEEGFVRICELLPLLSCSLLLSY